jgi:hypothetical protein
VDAGDGSLRYASGQGGVWSSETIVSNTGWSYAPSLVLDFHAGVPVVVFLAREPRGGDPKLMHVQLGRRDAGGWTVTELDTSSFDVGAPSLALTRDGQPRIALCRRVAADGGTGGLYYVEALTVTGPFTWTRIDTLSAGGPGYGPGTASLALDRWSDEPRLGYAALTGSWGLRYAYRSTGVWTMQTLDSGDGPYLPVEQTSLAFTPSGDPRIVRTQQYDILASETARASDVARAAAGCVYGIATSHRVFLYDRVGAEGAGAFTSKPVDPTSAGNQERTSARAVVSTVGDGADLVWRYPPVGLAGCTVYVMHATDLPTAGVPPERAPVARFAIEPNPLVAGHTLTLRLAVARAQTMELTLIDVAGRRVTSTEARLEAGASSLVWTPEGLRAGVYRVIARADGVRIGSAPLVVLR